MYDSFRLRNLQFVTQKYERNTTLKIKMMAALFKWIVLKST